MLVLGATLTTKSASVIFVTEDGLTKGLTINDTHSRFDTVSRKLKERDYKGLYDLMDIEEYVNKMAEAASLDFHVIDGVVVYGEHKLDNALGAKLLQELENGHPIEAWFNFAKKVLDNPSQTAREELCLFIEAGYIALCDDGDFLAYKEVRKDFFDCYTGTLDNSPGKVVKMPREEVNSNRHVTCSRGLHFCSFRYLGAMRGFYDDTKTILVKVNPVNVISIPSDYSNTKGRACEYLSVCEVKDADKDVLEKKHGSAYVGQGLRAARQLEGKKPRPVSPW